MIFVLVKHDNRWSPELINDCNHPVINMPWSHDERMTVIWFSDGLYLLVQSLDKVIGQLF